MFKGILGGMKLRKGERGYTVSILFDLAAKLSNPMTSRKIYCANADIRAMHIKLVRNSTTLIITSRPPATTNYRGAYVRRFAPLTNPLVHRVFLRFICMQTRAHTFAYIGTRARMYSRAEV